MSGATVVEGSGGASIQNLVKAVLANASATGRFGNAGLTFAPTDSDQVTGLSIILKGMPAAHSGIDCARISLYTDPVKGSLTACSLHGQLLWLGTTQVSQLQLTVLIDALRYRASRVSSPRASRMPCQLFRSPQMSSVLQPGTCHSVCGPSGCHWVHRSPPPAGHTRLAPSPEYPVDSKQRSGPQHARCLCWVILCQVHSAAC